MSGPEASRQAAPAGPSAWRQAVRGNVLAMGWVSLFTDLSSEMMNPLLPLFLAGLAGGGPQAVGWAALAVGAMEGAAETIASLLKMVSGRLSDRLGKRKLLVVIGYGLSTLSRPLIGAAASVVEVVLLKCADRVGKGLRTSPRDALIGDSVAPGVRGLAFSFHRSMDHAGAVVGPLLAIGVLYVLLGDVVWQGGRQAPTEDEVTALRWLFVLAVLPGLVAVVLLLFMVREVAPAVVPGAASGGKAAAVWRRLPRRFYTYIAAVTLFALGNSSDMFLVLLAKSRFGCGLLELITLWMALHVAKIASGLPAGWLSDRWGRRPLILAGWAVYALCYLGFAVVTAKWLFWVLLLAYGVYYGLTEGAEKALVADFAPRELLGTAFGVYHSAVGLALLPASLVFGVVWKAFGAVPAFALGSVCAGLASWLLFRLGAPGRGLPEAGAGGTGCPLPAGGE